MILWYGLSSNFCRIAKFCFIRPRHHHDHHRHQSHHRLLHHRCNEQQQQQQQQADDGDDAEHADDAGNDEEIMMMMMLAIIITIIITMMHACHHDQDQHDRFQPGCCTTVLSAIRVLASLIIPSANHVSKTLAADTVFSWFGIVVTVRLRLTAKFGTVLSTIMVYFV